MAHFQSALDLVREQSPEKPVALVRREPVSVAAQWFQRHFNGDVFYAVKANPSSWVIETLLDGGISSFDVASINEVKLVRGLAPEARLAFMHPVKSRRAIAEAYSDFGVKTFSLDTHEELQKILDATGGAKDLNLIVRLATSGEGSNLPLTNKFGAQPYEAPALLLAARQATQDRMGVSFHVGSQCMRPTAYAAAMSAASRALVRAGVLADIVDVGGGFPSVYPGMVPPSLPEYMDVIHRAFDEMKVHEATELWAEPGRSLVAESTSILARVELRKGDALYLNDGAYGNLFDATHAKWPFPVRLHRAEDGDEQPELKPFRFYGPTCDSIDHMPGPFWLPADVEEGDYVEIGMLGAYGVAMTTEFNGYGQTETVFLDDAPMASLFGLGPRSLNVPRSLFDSVEENKVVRLNRPKGGKRGKKRSK
ncbi:type III PLP-dependent enzyme [Asticcacaulis excentricus]|uniref:ornithine decarboxylase n=1 Tax=Asticcacaulis excentricus (strain ATCC 15261 / DSM 4724 / KCTC 12464 / NCIMB 9791 / VKM B-1370 / CB 48) TaxID=573065 RepID=E8RPD0_ASTEC|nr:type III PLP-dependent enzyme [Asticcacaulis excentricus]ADU11976.1 Orn/DAP/Arg decarboxylase 2 [Asticcacaulis excentricus CB 48]